MTVCDKNMSWGLTVDDSLFSWKTFRPVDNVHNCADFFTSRPLESRAAFPVIPRVPRSMKERME